MGHSKASRAFVHSVWRVWCCRPRVGEKTVSQAQLSGVWGGAGHQYAGAPHGISEVKPIKQHVLWVYRRRIVQKCPGLSGAGQD